MCPTDQKCIVVVMPIVIIVYFLYLIDQIASTEREFSQHYW